MHCLAFASLLRIGRRTLELDQADGLGLVLLLGRDRNLIAHLEAIQATRYRLETAGLSLLGRLGLVENGYVLVDREGNVFAFGRDGHLALLDVEILDLAGVVLRE